MMTILILNSTKKDMPLNDQMHGWIPISLF